MGKDQIRYWEPTTSSAWLEGQYEKLTPERQATCNTITEQFWMEIIARNSAGEGYVANDPEKNLPCIVPYPEPTEGELLEREMADLKQYLNDTDYAVIKCNELGLSFPTEYPEMASQRATARARINEIETLLVN